MVYREWAELLSNKKFLKFCKANSRSVKLGEIGVSNPVAKSCCDLCVY